MGPDEAIRRPTTFARLPIHPLSSRIRVAKLNLMTTPRFAGFTASEIEDRLLRPDRPELSTKIRAANERALDVLREARRRGHGTTSARDRRRILQRAEQVESLWEALAPTAWIGQEGRDFFGPAPPSPTRSRARDVLDEFQVYRAYPFYPEDVIALTADAAQVVRCERLLEEAAERGAALGWHRPRRVVWWGLPHRSAQVQNIWSEFVHFVAAKNRTAYSRQEPVDSDAIVRAVRSLVRPRWALPMADDLAAEPTALRLARRLLGCYETWRQASDAGFCVQDVGSLRDEQAVHRRAAGRPLRDFQNPFEPLVHVLVAGYVPIDITAEEMQIFFLRPSAHDLAEVES